MAAPYTKLFNAEETKLFKDFIDSFEPTEVEQVSPLHDEAVTEPVPMGNPFDTAPKEQPVPQEPKAVEPPLPPTPPVSEEQPVSQEPKAVEPPLPPTPSVPEEQVPQTEKPVKQRKARCCGVCGLPGHTRVTCPIIHPKKAARRMKAQTYKNQKKEQVPDVVPEPAPAPSEGEEVFAEPATVSYSVKFKVPAGVTAGTVIKVPYMIPTSTGMEKKVHDFTIKSHQLRYKQLYITIPI